MSLRRDYVRNSYVGKSMSGEIFRRDSQSLVVCQEYEDVQTFRNALTSVAFSANFELHMIRFDQRRVTASAAGTSTVNNNGMGIGTGTGTGVRPVTGIGAGIGTKTGTGNGTSPGALPTPNGINPGSATHCKMTPTISGVGGLGGLGPS